VTPSERRTPQAAGRRETDRLIEYRLDVLERLPEDLARSVGLRLDEIVRWVQDERVARRHHDAELDDRLGELRLHVEARFDRLIERMDEQFAECQKSIGAVGSDQKSGRRTILVSLISAAALIVAAIVTSGGHP
jgi:hypothetical protein